jgi:transcriptional regulator GlxA family with amidase domain
MTKSTLIFLLTATIFCSCQQASTTVEEKVSSSPALVDGRYNVGILIMNGTYNTEFTAPFDIFQHTIFREGIKAMNVFSVAAGLEPITTFEGIRVLPDYSYRDENLPKIDILVVPSAEHHLDTDLENEELLKFVRKISKTALYVTSHCDGAFVLAKSGVLNGIESTTFPGDIDKYMSTFPDLTVHKDVFFVHDGKFITSSGGAKSFEAALYLTEILYGKEIAKSIAGGLVIDWDLATFPHIIVQ